MSLVDRAAKAKRAKQEAATLYKEWRPETLNSYLDRSGNVQYGVLTKNIMDFENLYFNITRADSRITIEELKRKSVFDFYNYKRMLQDSLKK